MSAASKVFGPWLAVGGSDARVHVNSRVSTGPGFVGLIQPALLGFQKMAPHLEPVIKRNHEGVILRYTDPEVPREHHVERRPQVTDSRRNALIKAERELRTLSVIVEHLDISEIGMTRIADAIETIGAALEVKRASLGMSAAKAEAA